MGLVSGAIVSTLPVSELRGGIPLALSSGANPFVVFLVCVLANIAIILPLFLFLDYLHGKFIRIRFYRRTFRKYIKKSRHKLEKHIGTKQEFLFIFLVTALPLPGTGAYTASILSWYFGLKKLKAFFAIALGVVVAGLVVSLISLGIFRLI